MLRFEEVYVLEYMHIGMGMRKDLEIRHTDDESFFIGVSWRLNFTSHLSI